MTSDYIAQRELALLAECVRCFEMSREYMRRSSADARQYARRLAPLEATLCARMMALFMLCGVA